MHRIVIPDFPLSNNPFADLPSFRDLPSLVPPAPQEEPLVPTEQPPQEEGNCMKT